MPSRPVKFRDRLRAHREGCTSQRGRAVRRLRGLLACCTLSLGLTAFGGEVLAQDASGVVSLTAQAQAAFAHADFHRAAELFAEVAVHAPSSATGVRSAALLMQAKCLVNLGQFAAAETLLRATVELNPGSAEALYLLGYVLQRENKPAASLQTFTKAAALTPPLANDLKLVGLDYVLLEDYPDAIHWLARSVQADAHNAEAWYDLGRAQMHQGRFDEAIAAFHHTLAIEPNNVKAMDNLGISLEAQNKPEDALQVYAAGRRAADASHLPDPHLLLDYATLLDNRGAFADALAMLRQATALAASDPRMWEELSRAEMGASHPEAARSALERAAALDPANAGLHFQLGRVYRSLGLHDLSAAEFKRSSELYAAKSRPPAH